MPAVRLSGIRFASVLCLGLSVALPLTAAPAAAQVFTQGGYGAPTQTNPQGGPLGNGGNNTTFGIDNDLLGKLGGAAVGALAGSQIGKGSGNLLAIGAGGLLGYFAGGYLMEQLSPGSRNAAQTAETRALDAPVGQTIRWNSPDSTNTSGTITPIRAGRDSAGRECKEFQHKVTIDGRQESATGTACRGDDGQWRLAATP
ncbi:glycine zipper 2TM domain-containing protein [Azospirillum brasilense]|uniref:RT0821/Lpp0805 family surface protein n=1 Tax=Azospirillum brasilense TaxID=192 RepID=UPI001909723F|nr:RT0821/Lpp0805 family surface protein [Azospirillum brasilense]MBK3732311.1 glycine zipper 2TM domain-containing protein [Azospirillum brasilense]